MKHALSKITLTATQITKSIDVLTAAQIAKSINVLTAIWWVKQAQDAVSANTIINCFKHCGVLPCAHEATDPFAALGEESQDDQEGDEK